MLVFSPSLGWNDRRSQARGLRAGAADVGMLILARFE